MDANEEKIERLEFYQELLLLTMGQSLPFYTLVIKHQLSRNEVKEIELLCKGLELQFKEQKEEGFVTFLPLLTNFVGMLNYKLDPDETIDALFAQGKYCDLMSELRKLTKSV